MPPLIWSVTLPAALKRVPLPSPERRLVICGSMTFLAQMGRLQHALDLSGVPAMTPIDWDHGIELLEPAKYRQFKRSLSLSHMRKVQNPLTYAILVANFDKHGVSGYIGPNTFAEIAVAFATSKTIYLLNVIPGNYGEELEAWGARELEGDLSRIRVEYEELCRQDPAQMRLPEF